jgi:hypothetical protein
MSSFIARNTFAFACQVLLAGAVTGLMVWAGSHVLIALIELSRMG